MKTRNLPLPAMALVVAILATASLMLITHLRALGREKERMTRELERQGTAIVRTLESGARTGMMMRWGREQLQALLEEATRLPEIAYIGIYDSEGAVVAEHGGDAPPPPPPGPAEIGELIDLGRPFFSTAVVEGRNIFQVARKFTPSRRPRMRGRPGHMRGRGRGDEPREDWAIVLGLHMGPWEKVLAEGRRQTLLSFLVILITGSLALYLVILLQNHFVVRRTLNEMRAYAGNILENMADGLVSVGREGKVDTFNAEAARLLGRGGSDLRGENLRRLLPEAEAALDASLSGESQREEREVALESQGEKERPVGLLVSPLRDEEGEVSGAVLLLRDLTEVRRLQEKIREAEKLAALGQMAATVAHEIRNPLSSLKGFAQLFEGKFDGASKEADYARLMVREVDRLNRTITDLLFYSRQVKLVRRRIALDALLEKTVRLLGPDLAASGQEVLFRKGEGLETEADPDQLSQVFLNILLNAHQAAGEGGEIVVRTFADDGWCRVEISDSGPGMEPEQINRAFDPFFTTREKGSGLGLAIVKKIVDLHEGRVAVSSPPGEGVTVTVDLPRSAGGEEGGQDAVGA